MSQLSGISSTNRISPSDASAPGAAPQDVDSPIVLPEPKAAGDTAAAIAELQIETGFARRKNARDQRNAALDGMNAAHSTELNAMTRAADAKYDAAKFQAYGQLAQGGAGIVGTIGSSYSGGTNFGTICSSSGQLANGSAIFASGMFTHDADLQSADVKRASNAADSMKQVAEDAREDTKAASESVDKAISFLSEYQNSQQSAQKAALYKF